LRREAVIVYHKGRYESRNGGQFGEQHARSPSRPTEIFEVGATQLPKLILRAGHRAARRFVEFFTATIRNRNTRAAYATAVGQFFAWCDQRGLTLERISPVVIASYIEVLTAQRSAPTVKQHLAAIRMLLTSW